MNMKEAEMWLKSIIPNNVVFCMDFIRFHHLTLEGKRENFLIKTECDVWIGESINKHFVGSNWNKVVDDVIEVFNKTKYNEIPDLGFENNIEEKINEK